MNKRLVLMLMAVAWLLIDDDDDDDDDDEDATMATVSSMCRCLMLNAVCAGWSRRSSTLCYWLWL